MSRNANQTHAAIFERLIAYAADRGVAVPAGDRRVYLEEDNFKLLVSSKRVSHFNLGRHQTAALLQTHSGELLALSGFYAEIVETTASIREAEVLPGVAVALLADLEVEPTGTPHEVLDVVGAGSMADSNYRGHDLDLVQSLFPPLRVMEVDASVAGIENFAANLLTVCAAESVDGNGWINQTLADEIVSLGDQRIIGFPYQFLVRAVLDLDPTNLFLALYRCLEATYAYTRASELARTLGVSDRSWVEVAKALGESLSWYPRHHQSLSGVLGLPPVSRPDLDALALALGQDLTGDEITARVASGVRDLRNSLVHYGPTTQHIPVPNDWNRVCIPLARIVGSVFSHAYGSLPSKVSIAPVKDTVCSPVKPTSRPAHTNRVCSALRAIGWKRFRG